MKHIVIIGAGVSGLSTALALLERSVQVTLLERAHAGAESSWAGGGILSPLLPWNYPEALNRLALPAMRRYRTWLDQIERLAGCRAEYWACGMNVSGLNDPQLALDWCAKNALDVLWSKNRPNELRLPSVAQVRNPRLIDTLRTACLKQGGILREGNAAVRRIVLHNRPCVQTAQGIFGFDQLVIATGAWSGLPLAGLKPVPNIRPIRGQMLLFKLPPGTLGTVLYRQGLYIIPRLDGHILVGSTLEDAGFDKSTDAATARRLHIEAAQLLPALASHSPVRHWAGLRPGSPDNIPVIGRHPDYDNVFINAGHYRYGLTMAPAAAELLADLMEGKTPALDPTPYSWAAAQQRQWGDQL